MEKVFQVCFFTGTLFTVISFALGSVLGSSDAEVDVDLDTDMDIDLDVETGEGDIGGDFATSRLIALKPSTLSAFATVFGGVGMIALRNNTPVPTAVTYAASLGIAVTLILTHLIINPLKRAQNTSAPSQDSLIGLAAVAKLPMRGQKFGRIAYSVNGNKYSAPAKSHSGRSIAKGATVTVIAIVKGVFLVDTKKEDEQCP